MSSSYTPLGAEAWRESDYEGVHYAIDVPREGSKGYCAREVPCRSGDVARFDNDTISSIKLPPMTSFKAYDNANSIPVELVSGNSFQLYNKSDLEAKNIHDNISYITVQPKDNLKKRLATCCIKGAIGDECKVKEGEISPSTGRCEDIIKEYCTTTEEGKTDEMCGCYNIPPEVQKKFEELFGGVSEPPTCWYSKCVSSSAYQPSNWKSHQCRDLKICNQLAGKVDIQDFAKLNKAEIGKMSCSIGTDVPSVVKPTPIVHTDMNDTDMNDTGMSSGMIVGIVFVVLMIVVILIVVTVRSSRGGDHSVLFENDLVNMM